MFVAAVTPPVLVAFPVAAMVTPAVVLVTVAWLTSGPLEFIATAV